MGNYSTNYDEIYAKELEKLEGTRKAEQDAIKKIYDSQNNIQNEIYGKTVEDTNTGYESKYERNAVQKLINEKAIAEKNANLGLTDSGLNRTQQTAVQMSYANQKADIDLAKRGALDKLSQELSAALAGIEQNRIASLAELDEKIENQAASNAYNIYKANVDANIKMYEAEQDAAAKINAAAIAAAAKQPTVTYGAGGTSTGGYIISSPTGTMSRDYMGSLKDNNVDTVYNYNVDGSLKSVTYTDNNSGISRTFDAGVNPYYGDMHDDLKDEDGYYDPSKAFSNGYQPNNIGGVKLEFSGHWINVNGNKQKVFKCRDAYYAWDGAENEYFEVEMKFDPNKRQYYFDVN